MNDEEIEHRGYFPGSRTPLPVTVTKKKAPKRESVKWDARPTKKVINGIDVEFFAIGAVCAALGRPAVTIRLWIRQGRMPAATYRMPDRNEIKGRRLYTRAQIEALVRVAEAHDILDSPRVDWAKHGSFAQDVRDEWDRIKQS